MSLQCANRPSQRILKHSDLYYLWYYINIAIVWIMSISLTSIYLQHHIEKDLFI